jgi:hypothetical protein
MERPPRLQRIGTPEPIQLTLEEYHYLSFAQFLPGDVQDLDRLIVEMEKQVEKLRRVRGRLQRNIELQGEIATREREETNRSG